VLDIERDALAVATQFAERGEVPVEHELIRRMLPSMLGGPRPPEGFLLSWSPPDAVGIPASGDFPSLQKIAPSALLKIAGVHSNGETTNERSAHPNALRLKCRSAATPTRMPQTIRIRKKHFALLGRSAHRANAVHGLAISYIPFQPLLLFWDHS
jgi:hypothetical protein